MFTGPEGIAHGQTREIRVSESTSPRALRLRRPLLVL